MTMMSVSDALTALTESAPYIGTLVFVSVTAVWLRSFQKNQQRHETYKEWIRRARDERDANEHAVLNETVGKDEGEAAAARTATETYASLAGGSVDMARNVAALAARCRKYGRNEAAGGTNAITEEFFDQAHQRAIALQKKKKPDPLPLLYGIPISIKECLSIEGTYSTGGMACRLKQRDEHDSLIVQVLKKAGALPLCSGNVTQCMFLPESVNNIWGRSKNPWDLERTPGGSSGGDAALVAMGCVPIAACSDVAGSIRIPASFCGIVGFKPTSTRLSAKGNMKPRKENKSGTSQIIPTAIGPIARTVDDCVLFMKATLVPEMFLGDLNVAPIPFNNEMYEREDKLKIGYFSTDGWFEPCATSKRAIRESIDALTAAGHTCVPFDLPTDGWFSYGLLASINGAEGNFRNFTEALEGEPLISEYLPLVLATALPDWLRWIAIRLLDKRSAHLLGQGRSGGLKVWDLWQRTADMAEMKSKWSDAMRCQGLDVLIHPAMPLPAFQHSLSVYLTGACSYMFMANMLLWPSGVVPVTTVRADEAHYRKEDLPENQRDSMANFAAKIMQGSEGLPICVSVTAPPFRDETCLRAMKEVERLVNYQGKPEAYKHV